jgi:hypothetical protein
MLNIGQMIIKHHPNFLMYYKNPARTCRFHLIFYLLSFITVNILSNITTQSGDLIEFYYR